jgi:hypothetical protein
MYTALHVRHALFLVVSILRSDGLDRVLPGLTAARYGSQALPYAVRAVAFRQTRQGRPNLGRTWISGMSFVLAPTVLFIRCIPCTIFCSGEGMVDYPYGPPNTWMIEYPHEDLLCLSEAHGGLGHISFGALFAEIEKIGQPPFT